MCGPMTHVSIGGDTNENPVPVSTVQLFPVLHCRPDGCRPKTSQTDCITSTRAESMECRAIAGHIDRVQVDWISVEWATRWPIYPNALLIT